MSRQVKELMEGHLRSGFEGMSECAVVSIRGVSGTDNNEMRGKLREQQISIKVVKNSLARRAFTDLGMAPMGDLLDGPCAIVQGGESVVDLLRELMVWDKKIGAFEVKGAYLDGQAFDAAGAKELSKMPNRTELLGTVSMLAMSPGRQVAGAAIGPGGLVAGCIKGLIEKLEEAEAA